MCNYDALMGTSLPTFALKIMLYKPLRMLVLAVVCALPLFLISAGAMGSNAENVVFGDHPEYTACATSQDCLVVMGLCGEWRPVNREYEKTLADALSYMRMSTICKNTVTQQEKPIATCSTVRSMCSISLQKDGPFVPVGK